MSCSQKTIKEMRLQAKALLDAVDAVKAKGDDATAEEVAQAREHTAAAKALVTKIRESTLGDSAAEADAAKADLVALFAPDRPALVGDGDPARRGDLRAERWAVKSLGESLIESDPYRHFNPAVQGAQFGMEFPNLFSLMGHTKATFTTAGSSLTQYDRPPGVVMVEQQRLTIADLLGVGTTAANTIRYVREDTFTNAATTVAEEAAKPEATFDTSEADAPVRKVAVTAKVTDELYQDFPAMQSYIDGRLRFMVMAREEAQLLSGDGNAPNIFGILPTVGIQTQAVGAITATNTVADNVLKAITKVRSVGFFEPDGIVVNPNDYQILRLSKDANGQYYGGGPFMNQYGNGGLMEQPAIWGLRPVITTAIAAGTALIGAFRLGGTIFRRAGVTVQMTNSDQDDFVKNRITIRCEQRLALAVWRPKAFCTVTGIAAA